MNRGRVLIKTGSGWKPVVPATTISLPNVPVSPYHTDPLRCLEDGEPFFNWNFETKRFIAYKMPWYVVAVTRILRAVFK